MSQQQSPPPPPHGLNRPSLLGLAIPTKRFVEDNCERLDALNSEIARFNAELALTASPKAKRATDPRINPRDEEWAHFMRLHSRKVFLEGVIRKYAGNLTTMDPKHSPTYAFIQGRTASLAHQLLDVKERIDNFKFSY